MPLQYLHNNFIVRKLRKYNGKSIRLGIPGQQFSIIIEKVDYWKTFSIS